MLEERERTYTIEEIEEETGFDRRTIAYYVQEGLLPKVGRRGPRTRYPRPYVDRLLFIQKIRALQDRGQLGNYTLEDIKEIFETVPERMIADIVSGREPLEVAPYGRSARGSREPLGSPRERIERLRSWSERQRAVEEGLGLAMPSRRPASLRLEAASQASPRKDAGAERRQWRRAAEAPAGRDDGTASAMPPPTAGDDGEADLCLALAMPHQELAVRRVVDDVTDAPDAALGRPSPPGRDSHLTSEVMARLLSRLERAAGSETRDGLAERWTRAEITPDIELSVRGLEEDTLRLLDRVVRLLRQMIEGAQDR